MKLKREHIREEWSEVGSGDGYWIALKSGWKWAGDPIGAVHCIHEPSKVKAHKECVMRCHCQDCAKPT